jgi:hypothetical protein
MAEASLPAKVGGQWSSIFDWPIIGIHATLTPDGKILTFGSDQLGQQGAKLVYDVWDPATNSHYTLANTTPTDLFCCAAIVIPSTGKVLISGGDARPVGRINKGVADVNEYDYRDMSLSASPEGPMAYQRWYPTVVELANGKVVIHGGCDINGRGVGMPELYTPGEGWKTLTGAYSGAVAADWDYPRAWLAPNGNIVMFDATSTVKNRADVMIMDPSGNGTQVKVADLPFTTSWQMPAVKYAADKVLMLDNRGGAWIMDMSGDKPTFTQTGSIGEVRMWSNLVVLADGSVMLSGGSGADNKLVGVHNEVEIWNPNTGVWTTGDDAAVARLYHSTTILLPDATVLSLGGGAPGPVINTNGEIYAPAYLFNEDGSLATRLVITDAPEAIEQQQTFEITVDDAAAVTRLTFVKAGSVTHSLDMSTGLLELSFTHGEGNTLIVTVPNNANIMAPGDWMLFAFNAQGTPSVAATIFVDLGGEHLSAGFEGYVTKSGAATYDAASDIFTLTPNAASKVGAVMSNDRLDLTHDFTISFAAFLGAKDAGGSGIAFVLHNDPSGGDAFGNGAVGANGIKNGIAITFDTVKDTRAEPVADHSDILDTDGGTALAPTVSLPQLEDSQWHQVTVSWDAEAQSLTYWVDGVQTGTLTGDLAGKYFSGSNYVYFGFTGATGTKTVTNIQQVKVTDVDATIAPREAHPDAIAQLGGSAQMSFGSGYDANRGVFTLADGASKTGAIMTDGTLDLTSDFSIAFNFFLGAKDGGSYGAAFVLQNSPAGEDAIGAAGSGLGASGIKNGLEIAFTTKRGADTVSLLDTDASARAKTVVKAASLGNVENGHWHSAEVVWDAETSTLKYWVDGKLAGTLTGDLATKYFGGSHEVHFGFTGATAGGGNTELVRVTEFNANGGDIQYGTTLTPYDSTPFVDADARNHLSTVGSASISADNFVTLTSAAGSTAGSALSSAMLDLSSSFKLCFAFYGGSQDVAGGGFAFVLHNDGLGADALGGTGTALGAAGIANGLAIGFAMGAGADKTGFFDTDGAALTGVAPQTTVGNLQDNNWHGVEITWDASTQTLSYLVDGVVNTLTGDIVQQYLGGSDLVSFGFTGSTGKVGNLQMIKVTTLDADLFSNHDDAHAASLSTPIAGGPENDNLTGGTGHDALVGGLGADVLTGGAGRDHFVYHIATEGGDTIKDFAIADDFLDISASGFGGGLVAGQSLVAGTSFISGSNPTATAGSGTFLFNTDTHDLAWDADGSGSGEAVQIAHFDTPISLTVHHFDITV